MSLRTVPERAPIGLRDPMEYTPPSPQTDCDVCGALARQIVDAENPRGPHYNLSKATDLRVEMARHHDERGRNGGRR